MDWQGEHLNCSYIIERKQDPKLTPVRPQSTSSSSLIVTFILIMILLLYGILEYSKRLYRIVIVHSQKQYSSLFFQIF